MEHAQLVNIRQWIYRQARPLDFARYRYHFEQGPKTAILDALQQYQNPDGGFAHALEPDCWNRHSSPLQTWRAAEIIKEAGGLPADHPLIVKILAYLASGDSFANGFWANTILTNNDEPHAPWWTYRDDSPTYNPTIDLAGFIIRYAPAASLIYQQAAAIIKKGVQDLLAPTEDVRFTEMHTIACFINCYQYVQQAKVTDLYDPPAFKAQLDRLIAHTLVHDPQRWAQEYCCKPSQYRLTPDSVFYPGNEAVGLAETVYICDHFRMDTMWELTWSWPDYPQAWAISQNWWKADRVIQNLLYLRGYGQLPVKADHSIDY